MSVLGQRQEKRPTLGYKCYREHCQICVMYSRRWGKGKKNSHLEGHSRKGSPCNPPPLSDHNVLVYSWEKPRKLITVSVPEQGLSPVWGGKVKDFSTPCRQKGNVVWMCYLQKQSAHSFWSNNNTGPRRKYRTRLEFITTLICRNLLQNNNEKKDTKR